jgi:hypothetical protein
MLHSMKNLSPYQFAGDRSARASQTKWCAKFSKKHPFVELNWRALREQTNQQVDLADASSQPASA